MAPFPSKKVSPPSLLPTFIPPSPNPTTTTTTTGTAASYPPTPSPSSSTNHAPSAHAQEMRPHNPELVYGQMELPTRGILSGLGRSDEARKVVKRVLNANHLENHIFTNNQGFHNHVAHHVLAAYSLGAGPKLLEQIYELENYGLRPMLPLQPVEINEQNWTDYLGEERLYPNFLAFFHKLIRIVPVAPSLYAGRRSSVVPVVEKYLFGGQGEMLIRSVSGALHPLIHIGHGLEFGLDAIVAEGLAQCCAHESKVTSLFVSDPSDPTWPPTPPPPSSFQYTLNSTFSAFKLGAPSNFLGQQPIASTSDNFIATSERLDRERRIPMEGLSGFTILDRIQHDPELAAGVACAIDETPLLEMTLKKRGKRIKTWCEEWRFSTDRSAEYEDDEEASRKSKRKSRRIPGWEEIVEKCEELIWMATVIYASTSRPGYENTKLDFFLMHTSTSSLFLPTILEQISPHLRPYLLHSHFRVMVGYWVSRGRPQLFLKETLLSSSAYPSLPSSFPPQLGAVAQALLTRNSSPRIVIPIPEEVDVELETDELNAAPLGTSSVEEEQSVQTAIGGDRSIPRDGEQVSLEDDGINPWNALFTSALDHPDDHLPKVIRTLAYAATHFGHSPKGMYQCSLPGTEEMDGSVFTRAAGLTMKAMGWAREGEKARTWDRSVLGFNSAWTSERQVPGYHIASPSLSLDRKEKGRHASWNSQLADEEVVITSPNDPAVVGTGSRAGSRATSENGDAAERSPLRLQIPSRTSSPSPRPLQVRGDDRERDRSERTETAAGRRARLASTELEDDERELMG